MQTLLDSKQLHLTIKRLSQQLVENADLLSETNINQEQEEYI